MESKIPVWLDVDPGHDDAFALLFAAHHPSMNLLGVSTTYGNASLARTTNNALSVLEAIGKAHIPVFPGAHKSFCREHETAAADIHGASGLDGTNLLPPPRRKAVTCCNAIKEIRDTLMSCTPRAACLVCCGPLTNAALLFGTFPEVASHLQTLSIMGGAIGGGFCPGVSMGPPYVDADGKTRDRIGNCTPYAEFNVWCDPESAQSIFCNAVLGPKTVLIPLDLTHQALANDRIQRLLLADKDKTQSTPLRRMFNDLLMFFQKTYKEVFGLTSGPPLHDALAVAVLLASATDTDVQIPFGSTDQQRWHLSVILAGAEAGQTVIKPALNGVLIPKSLDLPKFWNVLNHCMTLADLATRSRS